MTLSTLELSLLRSAQVGYLPDTCTIQTVTRTSDSQGGYTETWADTYTGVLCRLAPQRAGGEQQTGEQLAALSLWVLTVTQSQALDETMRVVHSSETYEVTNVEDTHSWKTAKRAYLRRLD
jgi:head-tail adaptor